MSDYSQAAVDAATMNSNKSSRLERRIEQLESEVKMLRRAVARLNDATEWQRTGEV